MPISGAEEFIQRYAATMGAVVLGGGASFTVYRYVVGPAIHGIAAFVGRTKALYDKIETQLSPNGGASLVDLVSKIQPNHNEAERHWRSLEANLLDYKRQNDRQFSAIVTRLDAGEERFDRIEQKLDGRDPDASG